MFEHLSHDDLQVYWWVIISLLGAVLVFLMFVQGGQSLLWTLTKNNEERSLVINSLGRKWELTFTTLVTFGGAFFASFPLFYSTSLSGAYWVWMLLLFSFTVQAVSFEFRSKTGNVLGKTVYDIFLATNGFIAPLVIGVVVGTFFSGSQFHIDDLNHSIWMHPARGLEAFLDITNLLLGGTVLLLSRQLGAMYVINSVDNTAIEERARRQVKREALPFLLLATFSLARICTTSGVACDSKGVFSLESNKYLVNLTEMPLVMILLLAGVGSLVASICMIVFKRNDKAIWVGGAGTISLVLALFFVAGLNDTAFYPSTTDIQSSLTIHNSSSSKYTLATMGYVSLLVPLVAAYIWIVWRKMNREKISSSEIDSDKHTY